VSVADTGTTTTPGAGARVAPAPGPVRTTLPERVDVAVVGGGCSGLSTAVRLAALGDRSVLVLEGRAAPDPRSWCSWDDGTDPLPEARSASWDRWEVRTEDGTSVGSDPDHPYVLVRASDRSAAAASRVASDGRVRIVRGTPVAAVRRSDADTTDDRDVVAHTTDGPVRAGRVLDARGPRCPTDVPAGRVLLHQRFVGRWVTTSRPVFDTTTVTLMDFGGQEPGGPVRFVYVLPVTPTEALVESTLFTPDPADAFDHEDHVARYVSRRWGLRADEWHVTDEERGCIPMTDAPAPPDARWAAAEAVTGTTRPSSGYGFARSNRHSAVVARHLVDGTPVPAFSDRFRTRFLDAVFLRFLRDRPEQAAEAFRRLFALPGPLVVRFLSERSSVADDLRIVLALQKRPFLAALVRTLADAVARRREVRP
jgi:lycopene beta-cyclase